MVDSISVSTRYRTNPLLDSHQTCNKVIMLGGNDPY